MKRCVATVISALSRLDAMLTKQKNLLGVLCALGMSALIALQNISSGPLANLNDIGGWRNRLLFIGLTAAVQTLLLTCAAVLCRGRFSRALLRQAVLTAAWVMLLQAMNQKTFAYQQQIQPIVRAMDTQGLAAAIGQGRTNLSAPALTLLYLATRGPIYDMYMVKLLCMGCFAALAILAAYAADQKALGWRADALLMLCLILPQGFLSAACAAQTDVVMVLVLCLSLVLLWQKKPLASAVLFGIAAGLSGFALYTLPLYGSCIYRKRMKPWHMALAGVLACLLCLPAVAAGMSVREALASLVRANFSLPVHAAGVPNLTAIFPRAAVEEMVHYPLLRQIPMVDFETNAQQYYTQNHFELLNRGMTVAGFAGYAVLWAAMLGEKQMGMTRKAFVLLLGALLVCPGVNSAAWLGMAMLCLYVMLTDRGLRLAGGMVLFATAGCVAYPVTGELLLSLPAGIALCIAALCMAWGVIPGAVNNGTEGECGNG